ncbi:hypothetical protein E1B28_005387 [Marasmius oreades]|uniref:Uncharacterized protein n=1 Tax=Marasmius oreades TaxID=181124 RepID=A0A9P7S349_9AGAR|nr:uncharacterized protein E1B28_005387 [Marasmius oreades]KAG7094559.1 hypothetical protein E1B28_005387 [Marasmius oreades]
MTLRTLLGSILVLAQVVAVVSFPVAPNAVEDRQNTDLKGDDGYVQTSITSMPSDASDIRSTSRNQHLDDRYLLGSLGRREPFIENKARSTAQFWKRIVSQTLTGADDSESLNTPADTALYPGPPSWKRTLAPDTDTVHTGPPTWKRDALNERKKPGPPTWKRAKDGQQMGPPTWKRGLTEKQVEDLAVDSAEHVSVLNHRMVPGPPVWKA